MFHAAPLPDHRETAHSLVTDLLANLGHRPERKPMSFAFFQLQAEAEADLAIDAALADLSEVETEDAPALAA